MKAKNISLKWRIFSAFSAFLAILLALLWLFQTVFLNSFYKMVKVYEARQAVAQISESIEQDDIEYTIADLSNRHDITIHIFDADFNRLYRAASREKRSFFNNIPDSELYSFYENARDNGGSFSEYFSGFFPLQDEKENGKNEQAKAMPSSFIIAQIVRTDSGEYTIIANASITPVDSVITTLRVILIAVTAFTVLAALAVALLLSSSLTKPIKRISEKAKVLATGDYSVEFEPSKIKEINELSDSLNYTKTELGKIDTLQKELIANISHDLRTPLTLITGYAEVMRDIPGEANDENIQVIIDESKRLSSLVTDVLDISKFSAGVQQMNFEDVDLVACINSILPGYNKLMEKDQYSIIFDCGSIASATVKADRTRLLQVIYNLMNNAVSYTGEDKQVTIRLLENADSYAVHIIDTGEGISAEKLPYIWERYYKVDKNHRRAQVGSGLGLSIVKQILDAHGAAYGVSSKVGEGSDFWFEMKKVN